MGVPHSDQTGGERHGPNPAGSEPVQRDDAGGAEADETELFSTSLSGGGAPNGVADEAATPATHVATLAGRYRIDAKLGEGGFGAVYVGYDQILERKVAIKIPRGMHESDAKAEFLREARRLAQLQHSGIVAVYDVGEDRDHCYIVTEFLEGQSLAERLRRERFSWPDSVELVARIAEALAHAHARSMIHRDIKPGNILLTEDDRPVLLDFGLALTDLDSEGREEVAAGTPAYMAPEQVRGEAHRVDGRTDIYGLGAVLYQLLSGRAPFRAPSIPELFRRICEDDPQPPRQLAPKVPPQLEAICLRALAKRMSERFTTAGDFAAALRSVASPASASGSVSATVLDVPAESHLPTATEQGAGTAARTDSAAGRDSAAPTAGSTSSIRRRLAAHKRHVTVAVINFELMGADSEIPDPESQHEMLQSLTSRCAESVERYGGTLLPSSGQEVAACFGFPVSYEDAAERAVRTALEIVHGASAPAQPLDGPPQVGDRASIWAAIHSGPVVVEGSTEAGEDFSLVGDARSVASRMEPLTESGTVTISEETRRLVHGLFEVESVGTRRLRGVPHPIEMSIVRRATGSHRRLDRLAPGELTPLVGRDTELAVLRDRWEYAAEGQGQVVLLIGEAGLGKSRLIRELTEHVHEHGDGQLIQWNCSPYRTSSPLHPVIECFEQLLDAGPDTPADERFQRLVEHLQPLGLTEDDAVALCASLLSIPADGLYAPLELSPQRRRDRTRELLVDWLRELADREPVLLVAEDLHWVDASTLELLEVIVDALSHDPILILLTFRPEFQPPWSSKAHQSQVALNRLTKRQIREMIAARSGGQLPSDAVVERLIERTDGVPLFVEEFATITGDASPQLDEIPVTLQDLLVARLDRIDSDLRVIQLAAALGRQFSYEQLRAVSDTDEDALRAELVKLVKAEILIQKGRLPRSRFTFKHALLQDAAYQTLLKKSRLEFHHRIGEVLENQFPEVAASEPELLAQHFTEACDTTRAIRYWLAAGQRSQSRSANKEAIVQYRAGLSVIETLAASPERDQQENGFRLSLVTAIMAVRGYAAPEVQPELQRARELSERIGDPTQLVHVLWFIWAVQLIRAELDDALVTGEEMLRIADAADDDGLRMEAYFAPACTSYFRGEFQKQLDAARKGLALYDEQRCRMHAQFTGQNSGVTLRNFEATALWHLGFPEQALRSAQRAEELAKELEHPFSQVHGLTEAGWVNYFCGLGPETQRLGEEALAISANHDFPFWEGCAGVTAGGSLILQGRCGEGLDRARQALQLFRSTGARVHECFIFSVLAEGLFRCGQHTQALEQIDAALQAGAETREEFMHAELLRLRGETLLAMNSDQGAEAEACFLSALETARRQHSRSWELRVATSLARLWQQQGHSERAVKLLAPVRASLTEGFETPDLLDAQRLLERLSAG